MERKLSFTYTPKEAVEWVFRQNIWSEIFLVGDSGTNNIVKDAIDRMKAKGWDNDKILRMCSEDLPSNLNLSPTRPLPDIVVSDHPILKEWDETEVRIALHKMALVRIAEVKSGIFVKKLKYRDNLDSSSNYYPNREIDTLESFIVRLTQEAASAKGVENR